MNFLLYDGTFEGFLTLVYDVYHHKYHVKAIAKKMSDCLEFDDIYTIVTDVDKAHKVLTALRKKFSKEHVNTIIHIFLCDTKMFECNLLTFIILGFKANENLKNINYSSVFYIRELEKEYLRLTHRMYGFVRFEELEDKTLYAKVETKFNILMFLGEHFSKRLGNNAFIIHDIQRKIAYVHDENTQGIRSVDSFDSPLYSHDETKFKNLWKTFFNAVAIENRRNQKLQKSLVPLIYRTYMSEFQP